MTVTIKEQGDFNLETLARVALRGERVRLSRAAERRVAAAHRDFHAYLAQHGDRFIYGVTSDYGPRAKHRITPEEHTRLKRKGVPFLGLSYGNGTLSERKVRAMVFALLALCAHGGAAVSVGQARSVAALLDGKMPRIPAAGLTSPGEMLPLFYLFRALPELVSGPRRASAGNAAIASVGISALQAIHARQRLDQATQIFALSYDAFRAPLDHLDPALKALWGDPYEGRALDRLNHWLGAASRDGRREFQAPVSYRILPRVLGQAERAVAALEELAEAALRGLVSNPVYLAPDRRSPLGKPVSTGGFHEALLPQALDNVSAAWVDLASLAQRHVVKFHKGEVSQLPDRLLPDGVSYRSGRSTTYLEFVPNDWLDEMRRWAQPALLSPGEPGASEQDDVSAVGLIACRNEARVAQLFDQLLAVLAAVASQALHVTGRDGPVPLGPLLARLRKAFPPVRRKRELGRDLERLVGELTAAVEGQGTVGARPP